MDFLSDYWTYHSCYEIPRNYAHWSAMGLLSAVMHRKLCYLHGDLEIHSTLYIGLVGPPNQKKSTSANFARQMFMDVCPDLHIGPSRSSPEKIVEIMAQKDFLRTFTDSKSLTPVDVRPLAFFINEFKNFLGRSPLDMINFLTDIYDVKRYPSATLCRGLEDIINPAITIIMCETPSWFIRNMRVDLVTGGIARRFIICYETDASEAKPIIFIPPEARAAWTRVKQRLIDVRKISGDYVWGSALRIYELWYRDNHARAAKEANEVMRGYLGSKNVQLYKTMMLLDTVRDKPMFSFDKDLFDLSLMHLDAIEENMPKLSMAAGRNDMLAGQQKMIDAIEKGTKWGPGWIPEKHLKQIIETELKPDETFRVLRHLEDSDQIVKQQYRMPNEDGTTTARWMIVMPWKDARMKANGEVAVAKKPLPTPPESGAS